MLNRSSRRIRPRLESLEDRLSPAVFNIADGDVGAFIAAVNAANVNNQPDTINLAANSNSRSPPPPTRPKAVAPCRRSCGTGRTRIR